MRLQNLLETFHICSSPWLSGNFSSFISSFSFFSLAATVTVLHWFLAAFTNLPRSSSHIYKAGTLLFTKIVTMWHQTVLLISVLLHALANATGMVATRKSSKTLLLQLRSVQTTVGVAWITRRGVTGRVTRTCQPMQSWERTRRPPLDRLSPSAPRLTFQQMPMLWCSSQYLDEMEVRLSEPWVTTITKIQHSTWALAEMGTLSTVVSLLSFSTSGSTAALLSPWTLDSGCRWLCSSEW